VRIISEPEDDHTLLLKSERAHNAVGSYGGGLLGKGDHLVLPSLGIEQELTVLPLPVQLYPTGVFII
jgi:hypothetical protein